VLPLLPRMLRPVWFLGLPLLAGVLLLLEPDLAVRMEFYGYEIQPIRLDGFSRPFAYVFVVIAGVGGVYGLRTMGVGEKVATLAYAGSALGVVLAGDLLSLFFFWELKVASSVFLVWSGRDPEAGRAGLRYLFVHLVGGVILLGGILWHLSDTGSLAFAAFGLTPATSLILIGFLLSAAVPPLHAWLTDAYPQSTAAGMVFLSAFTTKASVYALMRGFPGVELLIWLGVAMALYGVVYAVLENDIRRLLAYHIISQVGYMVAAVGIGTEIALNGATAHAFAHILYKGLLLMGAGAVIHATGRDRLTALGGLYRAMPVVFGLYMIGALSISAAPLFSGFVSKEVTLYAASAAGLSAVVWLLKLASIGTFLHTGLKLPYFTWFGPDRSTEIDVGPTPAPMYVAMGMLAALNLAIGLFPAAFYTLLPYPLDFEPYTGAKVAELTQLLVFTALASWWLRSKLAGERTVSVDADWIYRKAPARVAAAIGGVPRLPEPDPARAWDRGVALWERGILAVRRAVFGPHADLGHKPSDYPTWLIGGVVLAALLVTLGLGHVG
jgi:multicomponent Na+:H+ antiporter subunit D